MDPGEVCPGLLGEHQPGRAASPPQLRAALPELTAASPLALALAPCSCAPRLPIAQAPVNCLFGLGCRSWNAALSENLDTRQAMTFLAKDSGFWAARDGPAF